MLENIFISSSKGWQNNDFYFPSKQRRSINPSPTSPNVVIISSINSAKQQSWWRNNVIIMGLKYFSNQSEMVKCLMIVTLVPKVIIIIIRWKTFVYLLTHETWRQQYAMKNLDCPYKDCIFYCIDIDARRTFNELLNIFNLPPLKLVSNYRSYQIFQIIVSFVSLSEWILLKLQTRDKRGGAARSAKSMIWIDYLKVQDRVSKVIASFF